MRVPAAAPREIDFPGPFPEDRPEGAWATAGRRERGARVRALAVMTRVPGLLLFLVALLGACPGRSEAREPVGALAEKPKVMVIMEEKVAGVFGTTAGEDVGQAESTIMERLLAAGFTVVDPRTVRNNITRDRALRILEGDDAAAAAAGLQYGAQVVITGRAFSKNAGGRIGGTMLQSLQATLQARVIRADDGRVISSRSEQGRQAHIDEVQGGALAIKDAAGRLADALIADILAQWRGEASGRGREVTLFVTGLVSYRHLAAVKQVLEKELPGVRGVIQRSFLSGTAELLLDCDGTAAAVADDLANRTFPGFRLEPTNVTPGRVDVRAVLE